MLSAFVITRGAKWQPCIEAHPGALGWAWEFHGKDSEISKPRVGPAEWFGLLLTRARVLQEER